MKRILLGVLAMAMLAGCGTGAMPSMQASGSETSAQAQAAKVVGTVGSIDLKG